MEHPDFPPNSEASKRPVEDKDIQRITTSEPIRKKKSLRKRFVDGFIAGDLKYAGRYVLFDVLFPEARNMIAEAGQQMIEKLIFGESRRHRGITPPPSGPYGHVNYTRYSNPMGLRYSSSSSQRAMSRQARSRHDFDEIVLESRPEAEDVIDRLFDLVSRYESATVEDLYDLVGIAASHTDNKWGWTNLRGAGVTRVNDGYLLDLPDPHPL